MAASLERIEVQYASEIAAKAKADVAALDALAKSTTQAGKAAHDTDEILKRTSQTHERIVTRIDGAAAATKRADAAQRAYSVAVEATTSKFRAGEITLEKAKQEVARYGVILEQSTQKAIAHGRAIESQFTPTLQRGVSGMKSATDASRSLAEQTNQTTSVFRQFGMQQGGLVGAFATGGAFAVGMAAATAAVAAFGTALKAIPAAGDAARASISRLSATVGDAAKGAAVFEKLQETSRQTGIAVTESASAFQRFSIAAKDVGATNEQVLNLVAGLQKFAIVSGASTSETAAATQQLGQALASGVLQGDELRSILENMPMFAQALARELGTSVGNLRAMGAEGKLTADTVFPAMMRAAEGIDEVFAGMPVTMARAQQQFDAATQSFLTHLDKAIGFSQTLASLLTTAAGLVDRIRGMTGGSTSAEHMAGLIEGVAKATETVKAYDLAIQDARGAGADSQSIAMLERTRSEAAAELRKFRDELSDINNETIRRDEIEWAAAQETRLAGEVAAHTKSIDALKAKVSKQYAAEKAYAEGIAKLDKARNVGAVSELDYLKISQGLLEERDEALKKLTKTEDVRRTGIDRTSVSVANLNEKTKEQQKLEENQNRLRDQIRGAEEQADAQARITAAYDGTAESIQRATNEEKAFAAVRDKFPEWSQEAADAQRSYADALNRSADASRELDQAQRSVSAIMDTLGTAADRVGQAIVDAFVSGSGAAVNMGNILKGVAGSILSDFVKLGAINPLRNLLSSGSALPTLSSGLGFLGGSASGGQISQSATGGLNIMNAGSNLSTFGGITDALGFTDFAGQLSGIGEYLGLTGTNGALSGIGNSITGLLNTQLGFGSISNLQATNIALGQLGGQFGPAPLSAVQSAQAGGTTLGGLASGIGLGYGAGSLAGGLVQSSLGKVGPAPQIGAGAGAITGAIAGSFFPVVGNILGGLIGGLIGGGGGGLIGPKAASPFSVTAVNAGNGFLEVGGTQSQLIDVSGELARLSEQVAQLNQILGATGTRIANGTSQDQFGQNRLIGANSGTWLNIGQSGGSVQDLAQAFSELRFSSPDNDPLNRYLSGRSFGTVDELSAQVQRITQFVNDTVPALIRLGDTTQSFGIGTWNATIEELNRQYGEAIATARELGHQEDELTAARDRALNTAIHAPSTTYAPIIAGLNIRYLQAQSVNDNNPELAQQAAILSFDLRAEQERKAFSDQLFTILGDGAASSQFYLDRMVELDRAVYAEREALLKQFNQTAVESDQSAIAARARGEQAALATITGIADYAASLPFSNVSPLNARSQYTAALGNFQNIAAGIGSGDFNSLSQLPDAANQLLSTSRGLFGSGKQFATDFESVQAVLRGAVSQSPENIVVQAIQATEAQQTAVMAALMEQMVERLDAILAETRLQAMRQAA